MGKVWFRPLYITREDQYSMVISLHCNSYCHKLHSVGIQDFRFLLNSDRVVDFVIVSGTISQVFGPRKYTVSVRYITVRTFEVSHVMFFLRSYVAVCFVNRSDKIDGDKLFLIVFVDSADVYLRCCPHLTISCR